MKKRFISLAFAVSVIATIGLATTVSVSAAKIMGIDLGTTNSCVAVMEGDAFWGTGAYAARKGRNPSTGEAISISASKTPAFKRGKVLKYAVDE